MRNRAITLSILLILLSVFQVSGSEKSEIYKAYIAGNMDNWKKVIDAMASTGKSSDSFIAELLNYQYGYIGWAVGNKQHGEAKKYLSLAEENLDKLSKNKKYASLVLAYRGAFYGYRISMNKLLAPVLGAKSMSAVKDAIAADEQNQFAWVQYGNIEFYMPSAFGGSKHDALKYYLRAKNILESDPELIKENWNYLSLLTVIAQAYSYTGDHAMAKQYVDRILTIEPGFAWVKNELYKQLYENMKN
jgi:tetratricopeptide (TPR) repeat protein